MAETETEKILVEEKVIAPTDKIAANPKEDKDKIKILVSDYDEDEYTKI